MARNTEFHVPRATCRFRFPARRPPTVTADDAAQSAKGKRKQSSRDPRRRQTAQTTDYRPTGATTYPRTCAYLQDDRTAPRRPDPDPVVGGEPQKANAPASSERTYQYDGPAC